jgi:hypothetical protein
VKVTITLLEQHPSVTHTNLSPFFFLLKLNSSCGNNNKANSLSTSSSDTEEVDSHARVSALLREADSAVRTEKMKALFNGLVQLVGFEYMIAIDGKFDLNSVVSTIKDNASRCPRDNCIFIPPIDSKLNVSSQDTLLKWTSSSSILSAAATVIFIIVGAKAYVSAFAKDFTAENKSTRTCTKMCRKLGQLMTYYYPTFITVLGAQKCEALRYMTAMRKTLEETHDFRTQGINLFFGDASTLQKLQPLPPTGSNDETTPLSSPTRTNDATEKKSGTSSSSSHSRSALDMSDA